MIRTKIVKNEVCYLYNMLNTFFNYNRLDLCDFSIYLALFAGISLPRNVHRTCLLMLYNPLNTFLNYKHFDLCYF